MRIALRNVFEDRCEVCPCFSAPLDRKNGRGASLRRFPAARPLPDRAGWMGAGHQATLELSPETSVRTPRPLQPWRTRTQLVTRWYSWSANYTAGCRNVAPHVTAVDRCHETTELPGNMALRPRGVACDCMWRRARTGLEFWQAPSSAADPVTLSRGAQPCASCIIVPTTGAACAEAAPARKIKS